MSAVYDVDDAQAPRRRRALRRRPRAERAGGRDLPPGRRRRPRADEHERARAADEGRARGGQARPRREADGDLARGGGRARASCRRRRRAARLRAAHRAQPHLPRRPRGGARRARSARLLNGARPLRLGGARLERVVLPARRRLALRPRRLQRDEPLRALRPGATRDGDGRGRHPRARRQRTRRSRSRPRTTPRCCSISATAASPRSRPASRCRSTARPRSSSTAARARSSCSATTGRPRAGSCGGTRRRRGASIPESDPHWQWTEGLRHLVDCVESGRPTITRPEHAYHALEIMLAAQAAGRDGVARDDRERLPRSRLRRRRGSAPRPSATPTTAGATMGYKPSPRPSFDAPTVLRADEVVRHTWGDPDAGLRRGLDLRLLPADPRDRLRHAARRQVHALGELPHDLRGRRAALRPPGDARAREPGDRRDRARRAGRERLLPPRHLAPRVLLRRRAAARARVLRPAARDGHVGRLRPDAAVPRGQHVCRRHASSATSSAPRRARPRLVQRAPPRGRRPPARPRRARRASRQHRAPHGRHGDRARGPGAASRSHTTARRSSTPREARCGSRRAASRRRSRPATAS